MKIIKKLSAFILALTFILSLTLTASASDNVPYSTYVYNFDGDPVESPHAYTPNKVIAAGDFGLNQFTSAEDLCLDSEGNIYVADTGNARVVVISKDLSSVRVLTQFSLDGVDYALTRPTGLFMTEDDTLYVADSTGINIYVFSKDLTCVRVIKKPESSLLPEDFSYIPIKISVDRAGRVYIVSAGNTYGVVALDDKGNFSTFIGAQKVTVSVIDKL